MNLNDVLQKLPLIAILRGVKPDEVLAISEALQAQKFCCIEVPLNSPDAFHSIEKLTEAYGEKIMIGAGTVLTSDDLLKVKAAGGRLIIMPHADVDLIRLAKKEGLTCVPGVATVTEAFAALQAGADALKLFPAELICPAVVKAMRAVLPPETQLFPVGGISPDKMASYLRVGANGFGLGGALYQAGDSAEVVAEKAKAFIEHLR